MPVVTCQSSCWAGNVEGIGDDRDQACNLMAVSGVAQRQGNLGV
jgi:hypothetical protein